MREYAIGLDIGIASVGWAVVALDSNERPCGIISMNSRIFTEAEHPKTGASLAAPRRAARSARRRLRRHRHRNERLRALLVHKGVLCLEELDALFYGKLEDIYTLRVRALDELLTGQELARVMIHLSQRRGFRSNRKNATTAEDGVILSAVAANTEEMEIHGYRTVGEMLLKDPRFSCHKRNKGGEYISTVSRQQIEDEVHQIFLAQRDLGNPHTSCDLEDAYLEILLSQRSFDEGPGGNSPYGGDMIYNRIGNCIFYPDQKRAVKASYSFEYFTLLEKINHIRIQNGDTAEPLTPQQRETLISLAHKTEDVSYAKIRKALCLSSDSRFNIIRYTSEDWEKCEKKTKLGCMKAYHQMRRAFDKISKDHILSVSVQDRNTIATALTIYKTSGKIRQYLKENGVPENLIDATESIGNFSKAGHLSIAACDKIIPFLEQGMNYSDACTSAGFSFRGHEAQERTMLLVPKEVNYDSITSPVAKRAISQTIKVINAIIRKQGKSPMFINVEVARELAHDFSDRKKIEKENKNNKEKNEQIMDRLRKEFGLLSPTGQDLVKLKLYEQQQGVCPYSQKQMAMDRIFDPDYAEIDHIIPYSISFDDSYKNKVLVFAKENREKGNRLPLQYMPESRRAPYILWVKQTVKDYKKQQLLLKEAITEDDESRFLERNLQDTKTASRFILNYLNDHLLFAPSSTNRKKRVTAVSGVITSYMRKRWQISKKRADGDLHHAVDALVVACTTDAMIQQISRHAAYRECRYIRDADISYAIDDRTGEVFKTFPAPWPQFHKELEGHLSSDPRRFLADARLPLYVAGELSAPEKPIFVSRAPRRTITGAAHEDTVKAKGTVNTKTGEKNVAVCKVPLQKLKLKNNEIENYYQKESDLLLYHALLERLKQFDGDAGKAFADPFHKPKSDGSPGPLVKKVKIWETTTANVPLHGGTGIADNGSMVRVDIFYIEDDGYYLVPVYVADTVREALPNKACVAHKPQSQWKTMHEEDFLFSLYPDDLVKITSSKEIPLHSKNKSEPTIKAQSPLLVYYSGTDISSAAITVLTHDGSREVRGLGVKTLISMEKYTVDILGEYHKVSKESRQSFRKERR